MIFLLLFLLLQNVFALNYTHYYDCNGFASQANDIKPWNSSLYVADVTKLPKLLENGSIYLSFASNENFLDYYDKIYFTRNGYNVIAEKMNLCPECCDTCIDLMAPGYDNSEFSRANVCGIKPGTYFDNQKDSFILGDWYLHYNNTIEASELCYDLPEIFIEPCIVFSQLNFTDGSGVLF